VAAVADHLYVHVPFCAHRCGYCDFVTVTGNEALHERYVDALIAELRLRSPADEVRTVFIGGGTPSLLSDRLLSRLLGALPPCDELTVECNPETITQAKAAALVAGGVNRVSLGAQSFRPHMLATLERLARPPAIRAAVDALRAAGIENLNLDLMFGVPGQTEEDLERDLDDALSLSPDHVSYYELEAKPGTRFTHAHGAALIDQAERMEGFYERVVQRLRSAGYRWYETANFCRPGRQARHNLGYWQGRDYVGVGVGAVSTVGLERRKNRPALVRYIEAVERGVDPPAEIEMLSAEERATERLMLGLRLDRPLELNGDAALLDPAAVDRLVRGGLVERSNGTLLLSERGRFVANDVVSTMLR
jgi:putative oxygen-independent coproporphyrinogen III oxidase